MDLTFDVFRQKYTHIIESTDVWNVEINNEQEFKASNDHGRIWNFKRCDTITNQLNCIQPVSCLVYHKKVEGRGVREQEVVHAVCYFQENLVLAEITLKVDGEICKPRIAWVKLNENWYQEGRFPETELLNEFESLLMESIYELPEFRLYFVTGLLSNQEK